jgi:hypothetical protein
VALDRRKADAAEREESSGHKSAPRPCDEARPSY